MGKLLKFKRAADIIKDTPEALNAAEAEACKLAAGIRDLFTQRELDAIEAELEAEDES